MEQHQPCETSETNAREMCNFNRATEPGQYLSRQNVSTARACNQMFYFIQGVPDHPPISIFSKTRNDRRLKRNVKFQILSEESNEGIRFPLSGTD